MTRLPLALALALSLSGTAHAQVIGVGSNSESNANSNSSSHSGAASDQNQGQSQGMNQGQSQGLNNVNTSGSMSDQQQGQSQGLNSSNANTTTAQQGNQQATSLTFEASVIPTETTVNWKGNTTVALAAGVSFSSDYCGGTASGGASAAGVSIGASKPIMDGNCQAMRRAEKFGVAAANAYNMGDRGKASALLSMQVWEICMAGNDSKVSHTAEACARLGLTGPDQLPHEPPAHVQPPTMPGQLPEAPPAAQPKVLIRGSDGKSVEFPADARVPRG